MTRDVKSDLSEVLKGLVPNDYPDWMHKPEDLVFLFPEPEFSLTRETSAHYTEWTREMMSALLRLFREEIDNVTSSDDDSGAPFSEVLDFRASPQGHKFWGRRGEDATVEKTNTASTYVLSMEKIMKSEPAEREFDQQDFLNHFNDERAKDAIADHALVAGAFLWNLSEEGVEYWTRIWTKGHDADSISRIKTYRFLKAASGK